MAHRRLHAFRSLCFSHIILEGYAEFGVTVEGGGELIPGELNICKVFKESKKTKPEKKAEKRLKLGKVGAILPRKLVFILPGS